jgi:hypothetical protein
MKSKKKKNVLNLMFFGKCKSKGRELVNGANDSALTPPGSLETETEN